MVTNKDRPGSWLKIYLGGSALQVDTLVVAHHEAVAFRWAVITARYEKKSIIPLSVSVSTVVKGDLSSTNGSATLRLGDGNQWNDNKASRA